MYVFKVLAFFLSVGVLSKQWTLLSPSSAIVAYIILLMCFCFWPVVIAYICVCVCMCVCFLCLTWIRCENKNKEAELLRNWHAAVLRWGVCSLPLLKDRMRAICTLLFLFFFSCLFVFGLSRRCERKLTAARKGPSFSTGELLTHSFFFFGLLRCEMHVMHAHLTTKAPLASSARFRRKAAGSP